MNSQLLDARYRILTVLNVGEVAQTYLVEDASVPNSRFVLKQLHPASNNPQALKILRCSFTDEVKILEQLGQEHDQIQNLVAYFEENEEFYLVQEFVPGNPLTEEILQGTPLNEDQVINLLSEVLEILVFVHSHEVIHQDIKPANMIRRESDNKLVLIDFGTVREIVTTIVGNLEYIPVEQLHGKSQYNSDIYALGIVAISALIGLTANEIAILPSHKNVLTGEILWRYQIPQINRKLAKILDKMIRFDYRKRYQSANEVLQDLKNLNNQEYVQPNLERKKNRVILTGIVSCIAVSLAAWFFLNLKPVNNPQKIYLAGVHKYELGDYKGAVKDLTKAIEINPQNALAYNKRGDAFYRLGDYKKAQADSSKAIELNPQDAHAYYDRGFSFYQLGKYKQAIADYNQAINLNSRNAYAYYGRGLARVKFKDKKGAMLDFNQAIALNPEYTEAYLQRGILHRRLQLKSAAINDFDTVIQINPDSAEAYYQRGLTHNFQQKYEDAIRDYNQSIKLNPKYIEAYLSRGDIYSEIGEKQKAIEDYNKVLQINPQSATAYIHRGMHRFGLGDYQRAIADYSQAIKLDPDNATAYNNRGNAKLEAGNKQAASEDYSQAIAINSHYALAYYNRGMTLAQQGNKQKAMADFQKAAKIFQLKGEKDNYQDAESQIQLLQHKSASSAEIQSSRWKIPN